MKNRVRRAFLLGTFFGALALMVVGLLIPDLKTSVVIAVPSAAYVALFTALNHTDKIFR